MKLQDQLDDRYKRDLLDSLEKQIEKNIVEIRQRKFNDRNFYLHEIDVYTNDMILSFKDRLRSIENLVHDYKLIKSLDRFKCSLEDVLSLDLKYAYYDFSTIHNTHIKNLITGNK